MRITYLPFMCLLISYLFIACSGKENVTISEADKIEIQSLNITDSKNAYLLDLWHKDQHFRKGQEGDIIDKFGYKSEQHIAYIRTWKENDNFLFKKIKTYLEIHGYPSESHLYNELALNAFPTIIGHNHNYKSQRELLPYIYEGYQKQNCSIDDIVWILGEMYESKNKGKRYKMKNNRFKTEDEFVELVNALNLDLKLLTR